MSLCAQPALPRALHLLIHSECILPLLDLAIADTLLALLVATCAWLLPLWDGSISWQSTHRCTHYAHIQ
eukprot:1157214-Pelagomonas_calceolata.AAC.1